MGTPPSGLATPPAIPEGYVPVLTTKEDVARALGLKVPTLNYLIYALKPHERYREFELRKRSGGTRTIKAPSFRLKEAQREIAKWLSSKYTPRPCVFGYIKHRNIQMNADCHIGKSWILRVDLKDFFPSITVRRVYGMFLKEPFNYNKKVAGILANLCCDDTGLPQGSPASPIISNIMAKGLDADLIRLARDHQCHYTRYCDDLVFSTTRRHFPPPPIASLDPAHGRIVVGAALNGRIERHGFLVNAEKTQLRNSGQRQMVTGLVTNVRRNVPRDFARHLRVILHQWETKGYDAAASWYFARHYKKNRPPKLGDPSFGLVVRGKVQHLGSVKGWGDATYIALASRLVALDSTFKPKPAPPKGKRAAGTPRPILPVFVEGPSDKLHIETALAFFQGQGRFPDLRLELVVKNHGQGSSQMKTLCKSLCHRQQTPPVVFLFDSDEPGTVQEFSSSTGGRKDWGNNVYSFVLPNPTHRATDKRLCIELLYMDVDLKRTDSNGRRLYLASEFLAGSNRHAVEDVFCPGLGRTTLVAESVFDFTNPPRSIGLTKVPFAKFIAEQETGVIDFSGFEPLLTMLDDMGVEFFG